MERPIELTDRQRKERAMEQYLKSRLQVALAVLIYPEAKSVGEAFGKYISLDDNKDYSTAVRQVLDERPSLYSELEEEMIVLEKASPGKPKEEVLPFKTARKIISEVEKRAEEIYQQRKEDEK